MDDDQCGACHNRHIEIWASAGERWPRLHSSHFHKNIDLGKGRSLTQKSPFERVWWEARVRDGVAGACAARSAWNEGASAKRALVA